MALFSLDKQLIDDLVFSKENYLKLGVKYSDLEIFQFAQWLGLQFLGKTSPNPMVSAILVDAKNKVLAYGAHEYFGGKHAEVNCIESFFKMNSEIQSLENLKMFVSLEPCSHFGKTPPCVDLLLKHKLSEICVASVDPNPLVAGKGLERLRQHNLKVEVSQKFFEATQFLNFMFLKFYQLKRPVMAIKYATSRNQMFARKDAKPYAFTAKRSQAFSHFLRVWFDAMLLGVQTIIEDRPRLDVRYSKFSHRNPSIIILDPKLRFLDEDWNLQPWLKVDRKHILFLISESVSEDRIKLFREKAFHFSDSFAKCCDLLPVSSISKEFSAKEIINVVSIYGFQSILVEGGMKTASRFYQENLVDILFHFESNKEVFAEEFYSWNLDKGLLEGLQSKVECLELAEDKLYIDIKNYAKMV